jgi:hypothetical protein
MEKIFCSIDGEGAIEVGGDAGFVAGSLNQGSFDAVFEGLFVGLADHSASDAWRSILLFPIMTVRWLARLIYYDNFTIGQRF